MRPKNEAKKTGSGWDWTTDQGLMSVLVPQEGLKLIVHTCPPKSLFVFAH